MIGELWPMSNVVGPQALVHASLIPRGQILNGAARAECPVLGLHALVDSEVIAVFKRSTMPGKGGTEIGGGVSYKIEELNAAEVQTLFMDVMRQALR